jgi:hypothetical protein
MSRFHPARVQGRAVGEPKRSQCPPGSYTEELVTVHRVNAAEYTKYHWTACSPGMVHGAQVAGGVP